MSERRKLTPSKPYAKLKDCAGQRFVGTGPSGEQIALLVFENAYTWITARDDEEEGPRLSEHQWSFEHDWARQEDGVRLGLFTREQVDDFRALTKSDAAAAEEARERRDYERLRAKFEGQP